MGYLCGKADAVSGGEPIEQGTEGKPAQDGGRSGRLFAEGTMRLTELSPHWVTLKGWSSPAQYSIGITFKCPHCEQRLGVNFFEPVDPEGIAKSFAVPYTPTAPAWHRTGNTFDTLTLHSSIRVNGHFHGHISNGEVTHV